MGLSLKDIVYYVRTQIGELQQFMWSDDQIIFDVNNTVQEMCSIAGSLTKFQNLILPVNGTTGSQEGPLDAEVDKIKSCKYFAGQEFPLEYSDWQTLQTGAATGSIPLYYYIKTDTRDLTPQSLGTSSIVESPIGPGTPLGETYRTVLGVWPLAPLPATIHVWYSYYHPWMEDPGDPCAIPRRFLRGIGAGVIARCLSIQKAYGEAQTFQQTFAEVTEQYRLYTGSQRQQDKPARYGTIVPPWRRSASSSVIFLDQNPQ